MLRDCCLSSMEISDYFVGIRFMNGFPKVVFPHGYNLPESDEELRKEIILLLGVLQRFSDLRDGETTGLSGDNISSVPLSSYQYIIQDFLSHGYYTEKENRYIKSQKGKINWKRTIQKERAFMDADNAVYLNFQTKSNQINSDNLVSLIHEYCVYLSFRKFGWLYLHASFEPRKPVIPFNPDLFIGILLSSMSKTFNDHKKMLFYSMIQVIKDNEGKIVHESISLEDYSIGVDKFDPIWERLIDYTFGEANKNEYFPHAKWYSTEYKEIKKSSPLKEDTIMKLRDSIYILDGKYYKYGITNDVNHLPPTDSIQKQITYGTYVAETMKVVPKEQVYNAFILPFSKEPDENKYKFVGVGMADWEKYNSSTMNYKYILGILLDTRWIINNYARHNIAEIELLSAFIEESLASYRKHETKTD